MTNKLINFLRSKKALVAEIARLKEQRDRLKKELFLATKDHDAHKKSKMDFILALGALNKKTMSNVELRNGLVFARDTIIANKWDVPRVLEKIKEILEKN